MERGFVLPITIIIVGSNGVIMGGSYTSSAGRPLGLYLANQCFLESHQIVALPTNVIYVDATGDAARVLIDKSGDQAVQLGQLADPAVVVLPDLEMLTGGGWP